MKVEAQQSLVDVAVLGYGNQAALFKIADDNTTYEPTKEEPYSELEFPPDLSAGQDLTVDKESLLYNVEKMKELNRTSFKAASLPIEE